MQVLHNLDAFATWQGGFDYYFAHEEDEAEWDAARDSLTGIGMGEAARLFDEARTLFENHQQALCAANWSLDEEPYLTAMRALDIRWRPFVPALHTALADWRSERGLEEFTGTSP
ncbi:MAG: hypothetical protein R3D89_03170 [Sphingomonadaceae bacterium]